MRILSVASLSSQASLYVAAGTNHFWHTALYIAIMPAHWSHPTLWVKGTGVCEILAGIGLLIPRVRKWAAWGIIAMLLVYFDVHIYMLMNAGRFAAIPYWLLWLRLPVQVLLIVWAWSFTRDASHQVLRKV